MSRVLGAMVMFAFIVALIGIPVLVSFLFEQMQDRRKRRRQARGFEVKPLTGEPPVPREEKPHG